MRSWLFALLLMLAPAMLTAQDARISQTEDVTPRRVPITGYTLAVSWEPEYCHGAARATQPECRGPAAQGFILHGLWPDGSGPGQWPQYCRPAAPLSAAEVRAGSAATPSPRLLQHEWAKHGTCMSPDPVSYFTEEQRLYRLIRSPDMAALAARRDLTDRVVRQAVADANPGITADMLRLHINERGWLQELWFCLGKDKRPTRCPAPAANPGARVRVEAAGA